MIKRLVIGISVLLCAAQAWAGEVTVSDAWVRATAPGQDSASVSLRMTSQQEAKLVAVSSPVAASAAIHTMSHEHGMMMMRETDSLPLPAKQEVVLGHRDHVMLVGLKQPLKAGDSVPLKLVIEFANKRKETLEIKAEVRPIAGAHDMGMHHHDH